VNRNNRVEAGVMHAAIADTYVTLDSLRKATPRYREIEELNKTKPDSLLAEMHDASVTALTRQGYAIAGLTDTTEVDFGGLIDDPPGFHALSLLNSGHRYFARKEYAMSRYYYLKCLGEEHLDEVIRRDATYKVSKIYRALNQWGLAYEYLEKYSFINDSLINDRRQRVIDKLLVTNQTFEQKSKIRELEKDQKITAFQNRLQSVLTFSLLFGSVIVLIGAYFTIRNYQHRFNANQIIHRQTMEINRQRITELENNVKIESMNSMLQGQEAERERVAKDLHDSLGGLLSTVKLHFDALQSQDTRVGNTKEYQKAYSLLDEACKEVRHISNNLQPGALHKLGLVPAVQDLIHRVRTDDGPKITFSQSGVEKSLDVRISLNVYRIVQELLNNALKHAEANEISINLTQSEDTFSLSVQDDGKGYEPGSTARMGMGTENIASRVNYLKGDLGIHTVLEEGTTTQIDIPLKN
jgi:signal transduction histidine kinase